MRSQQRKTSLPLSVLITKMCKQYQEPLETQRDIESTTTNMIYTYEITSYDIQFVPNYSLLVTKFSFRATIYETLTFSDET